MRMKPGDIATFLYLAASWGCSFFVVIQSIHAFGWVGAITFRCLLAGVTLLLIARLSGRKLSMRTGIMPMILLGISSVAVQLLGLTYATPVIGSAMTAIMIPTIPLFSMIISQMFGIEKMTAQGLGGVALGVVGIVLLVGFPSVEPTPVFWFGCLSALIGTLGAATGSVYASLKIKASGTWELTAGSFLVGGFLTLPLLAFVPVPAPPSAIDFVWLALSGGVMSGLNYLLYFRLVSRIGATRAVSVEFLVTIIAVIVGTLVLGEHLTLIQMVGAAVILAGCTLVLGLFRRRPTQQESGN